jgi:hypothetical protein
VCATLKWGGRVERDGRDESSALRVGMGLVDDVC